MGQTALSSEVRIKSKYRMGSVALASQMSWMHFQQQDKQANGSGGSVPTRGDSRRDAHVHPPWRKGVHVRRALNLRFPWRGCQNQTTQSLSGPVYPSSLVSEVETGAGHSPAAPAHAGVPDPGRCVTHLTPLQVGGPERGLGVGRRLGRGGAAPLIQAQRGSHREAPAFSLPPTACPL